MRTKLHLAVHLHVGVHLYVPVCQYLMLQFYLACCCPALFSQCAVPGHPAVSNCWPVSSCRSTNYMLYLLIEMYLAMELYLIVEPHLAMELYLALPSETSC